MAEIPPWAWMTVGLFVSISSAWIGTIPIFILVGAGFIAWGAFKLARDYMLGPEVERLKPWERDATELGRTPGVAGMGGIKPLDGAVQKHHPRHSPPQSVRAIACPSCKTQVWSTSHFCHFCGMRLRHPQ